MPTKRGTIAGKGRTGAKFVELYLDDGSKVELPHELWYDVAVSYLPVEELYFVERRGRLSHYVQWGGDTDRSGEGRPGRQASAR